MSGKKYFSNAGSLQGLMIFQQMACAYHAEAVVEANSELMITLLMN